MEIAVFCVVTNNNETNRQTQRNIILIGEINELTLNFSRSADILAK
jgi:hypothetical protein